MSLLKIAFAVLAVAAVVVVAKPSHPFGLQAIPEHFDFAPPVLPPVPFHNEHAHVLPAAPPLYGAPPAPAYHTAPFPLHLPPVAPAPVLHAAPAHVLPAPAPVFHSPPAHFLPAPAPLLPAPAHYLPAPAAHFLPAPAPLLPAPLPITQILPPVYEALPFAASYRAIPGPKTTTHHVSVGYAYPSIHHVAKLVAPAPHAHLHTVPWSPAKLVASAPHAHIHAVPWSPAELVGPAPHAHLHAAAWSPAKLVGSAPHAHLHAAPWSPAKLVGPASHAHLHSAPLSLTHHDHHSLW